MKEKVKEKFCGGCDPWDAYKKKCLNKRSKKYCDTPGCADHSYNSGRRQIYPADAMNKALKTS